MDEFLSGSYRDLRAETEQIVRAHIAPQAQEVDRACRWPRHSLDALAQARLLGLHVPRRLGGREQGLLALALVCEEIGKSCPSSALCFGMHCVATAVIAAKVTRGQEERYLRPIAEGTHLTTLALSEPGSGVHFYLPQSTLERADDQFVIRGEKHFITSGTSLKS